MKTKERNKVFGSKYFSKLNKQEVARKLEPNNLDTVRQIEKIGKRSGNFEKDKILRSVVVFGKT